MAKPTFQDYLDSGVLTPRPVEPFWLVRSADGGQFSTHSDRAQADYWAAKIGGAVEWYKPIQAKTLTPGARYDH